MKSRRVRMRQRRDSGGRWLGGIANPRVDRFGPDCKSARTGVLSLKKHIIQMDAARGLAILAVVAIHVSGGPLTDRPVDGLVSLAYMIVNVGARFAVPVFVVHSGLGMSLSNKGSDGYFRFLRRRVGKLLPGYVAWTLIYTLFLGHDADALGFRGWASLRSVPGNLATGDGCYHFATLSRWS